MMRIAADATAYPPTECWCCGTQYDSLQMVSLGNHPEVTICLRCVDSLRSRAGEVADRSRTGLPARARSEMRRARQQVIQRGWHRNRFLGPVLRWLGRRVP
jgi:hypothetical protein